MHDANPFISAEARRSGCRWLLIALAVITVLGAALAVYVHFASHTKMLWTLDRLAMQDLETSIPRYKLDYAHFPIPGDSPKSVDLTVRSRGPMLPALTGKNTDGLNPREVKFADFRRAKDRRSGLWQDDAEWVLSDQWGEPFYIILDTNGDGKIANPLFEAAASGTDPVSRSEISPPPEVPKSALIYSAGKDRDPKTWSDNIYVSPLR